MNASAVMDITPTADVKKQTAKMEDWDIVGCFLFGRVYGHPKLEDGKIIRSSKIICTDREAGTCETKNTIYTLGKPA